MNSSTPSTGTPSMRIVDELVKLKLIAVLYYLYTYSVFSILQKRDLTGSSTKCFSCYHAMLHVSTVFAVAQCLSVRLSVCPSVTLVHCIQMAEDIIKLLSWSSSPIILVFWHQQWYPIPRGTGAQNTRGWGKFLRFSTEIAIFLGNGTR